MEGIGLMDGLGSKSNSIFWQRHIDYLENQIEALEEYKFPFELAHNYFAWLLHATEYTFYEIRRKAAFDNNKSKHFDDGYSYLVKYSKSILSEKSHHSLCIIEAIRNILVHKGFPNTYSATKVHKKYDPDLYTKALTMMRSPKSYHEIKAMKSEILAGIGLTSL